MQQLYSLIQVRPAASKQRFPAIYIPRCYGGFGPDLAKPNSVG